MDSTGIDFERRLLESAAGRAVYDALIQANVNPRTVPLEHVKQLLVEECRRNLAGVGAFATIH